MTHATAVYDSGDGAFRRIRDWWQTRHVAETVTAEARPQTALVALVVFTGLVALVTFILSFAGLADYGKNVAKLDARLAWLVPIGIDGLTLCAVAATFVLRHASWHIRAYAWAVFGVAIGASVAGNLSHAYERHLKPEGMAGAAAWPILLALASHLVIVTRRAIERHDSKPAPAPKQRSADVTVAEVATRPVRKPVPARDGDTKIRACQMWTAGKSCQEIADALGVSKKSAERYTAELRQGVAA